MLPVMNTLWIGREMGPIERACLRSAMNLGHPVRLFSFRPMPGAPKGVECADAKDIVPPERFVRYANGSVAIFSNLFRYVLQQKGLGAWIDADYYFLKPHDFPDPYLFGRQDHETINNAIFRIPQDTPILQPLIDIFDRKTIPPWADQNERAQVQQHLDKLDHIPLGKMNWGMTGPKALSYYLSQFGLIDLAKPKDVFYPTHWKQANWILNPAKSLDNFITPNTVGIHLWNERIKNYKTALAPEKSFLARLQYEGRA